MLIYHTGSRSIVPKAKKSVLYDIGDKLAYVYHTGENVAYWRKDYKGKEHYPPFNLDHLEQEQIDILLRRGMVKVYDEKEEA